jgi:hypothetical protein
MRTGRDLSVLDRLRRKLYQSCASPDFGPGKRALKRRERSGISIEGFTSCGKTHVLCQGTALAGPYPTPPMRALAPEVLEVRFF